MYHFSLFRLDDSETKTKPQRPSTTSTVSSETPTNESTDKSTVSNQIPPKSPSPQRIKVNKKTSLTNEIDPNTICIGSC